jgi:hypothetical protein
VPRPRRVPAGELSAANLCLIVRVAHAPQRVRRSGASSYRRCARHGPRRDAHGRGYVRRIVRRRRAPWVTVLRLRIGVPFPAVFLPALVDERPNARNDDDASKDDEDDHTDFDDLFARVQLGFAATTLRAFVIGAATVSGWEAVRWQQPGAAYLIWVTTRRGTVGHMYGRCFYRRRRDLHYTRTLLLVPSLTVRMVHKRSRKYT